jgi:hypothetical protein
MQIKLSTGDTVHLTDAYTHKVEKAYNRALLKDGVDGIAVNMLDAYDAALSLLITRIEGKSGDTPYSPEWIDGLTKQDFGKLKEAVDKLAEDEAPKKNP